MYRWAYYMYLLSTLEAAKNVQKYNKNRSKTNYKLKSHSTFKCRPNAALYRVR